MVPLGGATEAEVLAVAAGVEGGSSHPLATAILARAAAAGVQALPASGARAIVGKGVEATVGGALAWVASPKFAAENGVLDGEGHLTLFVNRVGEVQEWLLKGLSP